MPWLVAYESRTAKAYERRMMNISSVMQGLGRPWVKGLAPLSNVGPSVRKRLSEIIASVEASPTYQAEKAEWRELTAKLAAETKRAAYLPSAQVAWPFPADEPERAEWPQKTAPAGVPQPTAISTTVFVYQRDETVRCWVLARALGRCECCGDNAPFLTAEGEPFLEVHHLRQLAKGGSDTVTNTAALCPNCHRHLHYGRDAEALLSRLYELIPELQRE